jgi:hydrogenase maturation protease
MPVTRVLLIGYGNPGRGDDGLGPALAQAMADAFPTLSVDIDYQLTVDHAALIAAHDAVIFADAMIGLPTPYCFAPVTGTALALGSHQVSPQAAMTLSELLFVKRPQAWTLAISGDDFDRVHEGLSPRATANLALASDFLRVWINGLQNSGQTALG